MHSIRPFNHLLRSSSTPSSPSAASPIVKIFSDASLEYGAWIDHTGRQDTYPIPKEFQYSSYASEFYAAQKAIKNAAALGNQVHIFCDNQGVCLVLMDQEIPHPGRHPRIANLLMQFLAHVNQHGVQYSVSHIASESNPADAISRHPLTDADRATAANLLQHFIQSHSKYFK